MQKLSSLLLDKTPKYEITIPSTGKATRFRPFLVKEEKILLIAQSTQSKKDIMLAIKDIIESCVEGISNAGDLPIFDIEYIFMKLRAKSVGEVVQPIIVCPETGEKVTLDVNIDELELKKSKAHKKTIKLDKGLVVKMKYPSINILEKFGGDIDTTNTPEFYDMILHCIESIETPEVKVKQDEVQIEELKEFVDSMTKQQFDMILNFFVTAPRLESVVDYETEDGQSRKVTLSGLGDFFG